MGLGMGRGGRTYKVKIETLLKHLRENRENHSAIVEKAQAKFREKAIERLEEMLRNAREGTRLEMRVDLEVPSCHLKEYDAAIGILEMTREAGEEFVEIDSDEYNRFVLDRWEWVGQFLSSNSAYV